MACIFFDDWSFSPLTPNGIAFMENDVFFECFDVIMPFALPPQRGMSHQPRASPWETWLYMI
jgi:hypothetical protein